MDPGSPPPPPSRAPGLASLATYALSASSSSSLPSLSEFSPSTHALSAPSTASTGSDPLLFGFGKPAGISKAEFSELTTKELEEYLRSKALHKDAINAIVQEQFSGISFLQMTEAHMNEMGLRMGAKLHINAIRNEIEGKPLPTEPLMLSSLVETRKPIPQAAVTIPNNPAPSRKGLRVAIPEETLKRWIALIESGNREQADIDVRSTFDSLKITNGLCPFANCNTSSSERHPQDFLNHILEVHVQFKRFRCPKCAYLYSSLVRCRRHLREVHKLEKVELENIMQSFNELLKVELQRYQNQLKEYPSVIPLSFFPQEGPSGVEVTITFSSPLEAKLAVVQLVCHEPKPTFTMLVFCDEKGVFSFPNMSDKVNVSEAKFELTVWGVRLPGWFAWKHPNITKAKFVVTASTIGERPKPDSTSSAELARSLNTFLTPVNAQ